MNVEEDILLVARAKNNRKDFSLLYKKYHTKIFDYFWYRTNRNRELSEDLLQETFLRAYTHIGTFQDQGYSYLTYLLAIAHNVLINQYRKPESLSIDTVEEASYEIARDIEYQSDTELLWHLVDDLPRNERETLVMYYCDDMSVAEIAAIVEKSENAVKLILSRGRKKLKNHPIIQAWAMPEKNQKNTDFHG